MDTETKNKVVEAFKQALDTIDDKKDAKTATKETVIALVLDETGSMQSCKDTTISAYNEYVNSLRDKDGFRLGLTTFNASKMDVGVIEPIKNAKKLNHENYQPASNTPLFDAVGKTIRHIEKEAKKDEAILFVILTDGEENSSREYTKDAIKSLIDEKTKAGWTFVYLAANQDAWEGAKALNISAQSAMNFDNKTVGMAMCNLSAATVRYAASGSAQSSNYFKADEQDVREAKGGLS